MELHRFADWEDRLRTYLDRVNEDRFRWGEHDCALFAASATNAMTGIDPAESFRGTYDTARGAALALRAHGAGTLLKTVRSWLGDSKSVHLAQRGDIVMKDRSTTGICVGQFSVFVGEEHSFQGLVYLPTRDCRYAFTLPYAAAFADE